MAYGKNEIAFRVHIRREASGTGLVVRFECNDGMGVLGLRQVGREDPSPALHYEEGDIPAEALRASRFVHVLQNGQRQSYALSRVTEELSGRLPQDAWVELSPVTEYGFRYLVIADEAGADPGHGGQGWDEPESNGAPAAMLTDRSVPEASAGAAHSARTDDVPARQVPVAPSIAAAALDGLSRDQALTHLRHEMAKVDTLHNRVVALETELETSRARERDLLEVLQRWQSR